MTYFTIGQIHREKLLKSNLGTPYKDKGTILRVVLINLKYKKIKTPNGNGYAVSASEIARWNKSVIHRAS